MCPDRSPAYTVLEVYFENDKEGNCKKVLGLRGRAALKGYRESTSYDIGAHLDRSIKVGSCHQVRNVCADHLSVECEVSML